MSGCDVCGTGLAGVVVGLLALGEGMPSTFRLQALRLASWLCITAGVSALAGGRGKQLSFSPFDVLTSACMKCRVFEECMLTVGSC